MSCNPAIGGLAKGQLVREIDALGGQMGWNTDLSGIQFRMLNRSRGPSVWGPRAQCDKKAYQFRLKHVCETQPRLDCKQGQTVRLVTKEGKVSGVETAIGVRFIGKCVVLTTGTFLGGLLHVGSNQIPGGRAGESAAYGISDSLRELGLELGRFKTGTPPRLTRNTLDFSKMEIQEGDEPVPFFSFWKEDLFHVERESKRLETGRQYPPGSVLDRTGRQLQCFITYTTEHTARLVRDNIHKSPMYSGQIEGIGPRYCPSIEDKIVRFADKERHQIFLEPEGVMTEEYYINGLSTSLPFEVQVDLVRSVIGCENAEILRPAYAVEYDYVLANQLCYSLETRTCANLFLAGQINGTSGYEEAGAQGLIAGINAARRVHGMSPVILGRHQAFIGVMIDDLISKGISEPYRLFTSRAEHRLTLRQDNADLRLAPVGREVGLLPLEKFQQFESKYSQITSEIQRLERTRVGTETLAGMLRRPKTHYSDLPHGNGTLSAEVIEQVELTLKYAGYIRRQEEEVAKTAGLEAKRIPRGFDFEAVLGLRKEAVQKLVQHRPETVGQASRISGVTPADISVLVIALRKGAQSV